MKIYDFWSFFWSFFDHQKSTRRYANWILDVRYGERKSKLDFRSRHRRYSRNGSKTMYFFDQNTWFLMIFRSAKSTRRYVNSILDVRYGERKSKLDFRSRDRRYSRNGSKTTYFFDQNTWFSIIFRSEKSTRRYVNSILMSDMAGVKKRLAWGSNPRATSSFRHVNFVREASASSIVLKRPYIHYI